MRYSIAPRHLRPALIIIVLVVGSAIQVTSQQPSPAQPQGQRRAPALRPAVMGPTGGVSTGHPLTTAAAFETLLKGGNAFDAGVTALLVGGVVEQDLYSLGREALVNIVEFWDDWYPNLHQALEWPRVQTRHFHGSFWPHTPGFNKLNLEAAIPDEVFNELKARGHDVSRIRPFGMSGCATTVMIDPATQNRFAAADPRRDCHALAY